MASINEPYTISSLHISRSFDVLLKARNQRRSRVMAYRTSTVCIMAVLLFSFTLTSAARPEPAFADVTPMETLYGDNAEAETVEVEKSCEGVGEDECLTRRTLAAQIDYIYTQKHKP